MPKRPTFVLPAGLELELTDAGVSIRYDGDVRIEDTGGRRLDEIHVGGDLDLKLAQVTGTLIAGGTLTITGDVEAEHIHGREVVLGRQKVRCRAISASQRITVGAADLTVDCIIAPEINLDPKASGRVTVIESHNERGATKIKGGFSLADYDDMFGNAGEFLAERGLEPLGEGGPPPPREVASVPPEPAPEEEDVEDPLSLSLDDIEPLMEQAQAEGAFHELHIQLSDALERITSCYEGHDLPPAVAELQLLVQQRDYDALRSNITEVWNGLLGFHQKRGIRPHHQVTHAFNVIHGLVQQ